MDGRLDISLHFDFKEKVHGQKVFSVDRADEAFEIMQLLGVKYFNTWCNDEVYPEQDDNDILFANTLAKKMKETDIKMSSFHFVGSVLDCYHDSQERIRHYMKRSLDVFQCCNPKSFVLHPGTYDEGGFKYNKIAYENAVQTWGEKETYQKLVSNLRFFGEEAEKAGIKIAVENLFQGRFYSKIDDLIQLVLDVDHDNVGFCLDTGHANVDHVDVPTTIKRMGSKLYEVHLHDNNGTQDQHLPIGFGTLDWISIINALKENNYSGTATYEFFRWPYTDRLQGIKNAVALWDALESITSNGYFTSDWNR